jgi:DNA polymerase III subunit alpha
MKQYINLHTHGIYSFLDGHGKYPNYAERAKELGMAGLGITEHGNIHGWLDFYDECIKVGIKPILGMEAYQARKTRWDRDEEERSGPSTNEWGQRGPYHLTLLAQNNIGYHNIIKLSSQAYTEGYYVKPRIDHELLAQYSEGVIILSGCLSGEVQQALLRGSYTKALHAARTMQDIVGKENYFIEIHDHGIEEEHSVHEGLIKIAEYIGAPIVPTGDCHYVMSQDAHAHDVMLCVSTNATVDQENRFRFKDNEFFLKSYDEMAERFDPKWLDNTMIIQEMVDLNLEFDKLHFPSFPDTPANKTPDEYLKELVWEAVPNRYPELTDKIKERIEYELGVIQRMGFPEYFLVVADLVNFARQKNIRVGWGRGSAAGSIISYCLGITNLDPIKFNLMFERFLVEGRKSMPDIDLDFDSRYRDQVVEYARNKYGANRVVNIATFTSIGARTAIKDTARVLGFDYAFGDKLSKLIPPPVLGVSKSITEALKESAEFKALYDSDSEAKHVIDTAKGLEGVYRQPGIHAAGIVIAKSDVTDYVPVMQKGEGKPIVTQWEMYGVERNGLLKIDFLALRNLDVIDICVDNIKKCRGIDLDVDTIPEGDPKTFEQLKLGHTSGVFQIESGGMTNMTRDIQPNSIEDIMAIMSLYRPGPMGSDMDKMFINRRHGRAEVIYFHPSLIEVMERSLGIMLYQEDVLAVARILAGFTAAEADDLRKAIGKKLMDKIGLYRSKFVEGCKKTHNVSSQHANKIYSDIEYFGGYGFGLAHAASYAMLGYVTAYLKAHYPKEYMAALMTSVSDNELKMTAYLNECRRMGIPVHAPSISKSESEFSFDDEDGIVFGLSAIKGIGGEFFHNSA